MLSGGQKLEETTYAAELEKTLRQVVEQLPDHIKEEVYDRLSVILGAKHLHDLPDLRKKVF